MIYIPFLKEYTLDGRWDLIELFDRGGVLSLNLIDLSGRRLAIIFDSYLLYRKMDEGDAMLTLSLIRNTGGLGKYFYKVEDSDLIRWFQSERCYKKIDESLHHITVAADNDIIDIVTLDLPTVHVAVLDGVYELD
jgi:hypothetical protein